MRAVLGTGLSGLVGTRVVELLGDKYNFTNLDITEGIDILDPSQIEQKISSSKADTLIHLAAFTDVDNSWEQNGDKNGLCYKLNVSGTQNIVASCRKFHKFLIHISTDFVFDGKKEGVYTEGDVPNPIEWYGQTKLWAESQVKKSGIKNVILRIAFPYSPKPFAKLDLVHKIMQKFEKKEKLNMFYDTLITPTFIDDIAKVIQYCIDKKPDGIYHCVGSSILSPYRLAILIADRFGFDKNLINKVSADSVKIGRPRQKNLSLSNKKLQKEFGFKMHKLEEALAVF